MNTYAYLRVSTREQHLDRQILALEPFDVPERNIFRDWQSGKDFARPAYQELLSCLGPGDLLIVKSIDRLGRNYSEILVQWQHITKEIGAHILVLDMELLDTRRGDSTLTGTLVADLVLQILAYVAQTERDYIHQRQMEGIAAARAKGKHLGRAFLPLPEGFETAREAYLNGTLTLREAARQAGMSVTTFYRRCKEGREQGELTE